MLDRLRGTFEGKGFAVLGSAPSLLNYFEREADIIIGVNGASKVLSDGDLFLSADQFAFTRSWFNTDKNLRHFLRGLSAIHSFKLYPDNSLRSRLIREHNDYIKSLDESNIIYREDLEIKVINDGKYFDEFFSRIPHSQFPHELLHSISRGDEPISRNQKALNVGGTSACMAVQLAYVMGAREIHLYGIEFSNSVDKGKEYTGTNYFYKSKSSEGGMTLLSQRDFMDKVIMEIRKQNTDRKSVV